jgi:hypothetical protein
MSCDFRFASEIAKNENVRGRDRCYTTAPDTMM